MIADLNGVVQSVRVVADLIQANKSFRNFNELVSAVAEVNTKLVHFLSIAVEAKEKELTLNRHIEELEKENLKLKDWQREAKRYKLTEIAPSVFARTLKPGMEQSEPAHMLCTNCFYDHPKPILQLHTQGLKTNNYLCQHCGKEIRVPHNKSLHLENSSPIEDWTKY